MKEIENLFIQTFKEKPLEIKPISVHGSNRKYYRVVSNKYNCIGVYNEDVLENKAFISFAEQLKNNQINVPQIYAQDLENNVYLQQDLGDETLFTFLQNNSEQDTIAWYEKIIKQLPKIQTIDKFDYTDAYPRKAFDRQSIQWDLNYFKYYFLKLALIPFNEEELENDFQTLTNFLLSTDTSFLLYRDFQSRNIMLFDDKAWFIDFQGGRQGALQYDIASLLYDAKANLDNDTKEKLLNLYIKELQAYINIDKSEFKQYYYAYVYIRIMQAMGSYGYRGYFERKSSFLQSIPAALNNLKYLEDNIKLPINIPTLHKIFQRLITSDKLLSLNTKKSRLTINIKSFSYKKGYPHDTSGNGGGFVFDCRALPNPGREEKYKHKTGLDKEVAEYLQQYKEVDVFFENAMNLINQSIDNYLKRDFSNLSVYFGCTGGQHRSVYLAQRCGDRLSQNTDLNIVIQHLEQNI